MLLLAAGLSSSALVSADVGSRDPHAFAQLDVNGDGELSRSEISRDGFYLRALMGLTLMAVIP